MESIKVDVDGLSALSGVCHREAEQLVVGLRDWQEGPNFRPPPRRSPNVLLAGSSGPLPPLPAAPHLIYCYPSARPDFWWCEGYDIGGGPYGFDSPIDVSGVG